MYVLCQSKPMLSLIIYYIYRGGQCCLVDLPLLINFPVHRVHMHDMSMPLISDTCSGSYVVVVDLQWA